MYELFGIVGREGNVALIAQVFMSLGFPLIPHRATNSLSVCLDVYLLDI